MGLLSGLARVLFGAKASGNQRHSPDKRRVPSDKVSVEAGWMQRDQTFFYGKCRYSPCGRWAVACMDGDGKGRSGNRESGNGTVLLLSPDGSLAHEIDTIERPFSAAVSSIGQYVVQDVKFGNELSSDAIVISSTGKEIFRRRYTANIYNVDISDCGNYIAVQTAGGDASNKDAHLLEVIDTRNGVTLFSREPESGWADGYAFEVALDGRLLSFIVQHKYLGEFRYSPNGEFLDREALLDASLNKGSPASRFATISKQFKDTPSPDIADKAIAVTDEILSEGKVFSPAWNAMVHRLAGEAHEYLGHLDTALAQYDEALTLDPKVGVKRKADALRKRLRG